MFIDAVDFAVEDKLLWYSVLRRAIFDYALYRDNPKQKVRWVEADKYIFGTEDREDGGLSFDEVCALFGWDPDYIRRLTLQLDKTNIRRLENNIKSEMDHKPEYVIPRKTWTTFSGASVCFIPSFFFSTSVWEQVSPKKLSLYCLRAKIPL